MFHRAPGSIGASSYPSRVFRGHHLPGHMGAERQTVRGLRVVSVDAENNLVLIEGAVPWADRRRGHDPEGQVRTESPPAASRGGDRMG